MNTQEIEGVKMPIKMGNETRYLRLHKKFEDLTSLGGFRTTSTDSSDNAVLPYPPPPITSSSRILPKYANLPSLQQLELAFSGRSRTNTSTDWNDKLVLRSPKIQLTTLSYDELMDNCQEAIRGLTMNMTIQRSAIILNLAWNMRSRTHARKRVFPQETQEESDRSIEEMCTHPLDEIRETPIQIPFDRIGDRGESANWELIRQFCYLCASLLRLFTKNAASWMRTRARIESEYHKLTGVKFMIPTTSLRDECLNKLENNFKASHKLFSNALGEIIYALHDLEGERRMVKMLFEDHLNNTGMHIVDLFCRAVRGMKCVPSLLMNALWKHRNDDTLCQLAQLIKTFMGSRDEDKIRETYRFARLFDSNMFSLLQTKNCLVDVCTLAHICILVDSEENQGVLQITALANLCESIKTDCSFKAKIIYDLIMDNGRPFDVIHICFMFLSFCWFNIFKSFLIL